MTQLKNQLKKVQGLINMEGLEDAMFNHDFKDIESKTFHRLRLAYLKSQTRLEKYISKHSKGE